MTAPTTAAQFRKAAERLVRTGHPDAKGLTIDWRHCSRRFVGADGQHGHFCGSVFVTAEGFRPCTMIASYVPGHGMSVR